MTKLVTGLLRSMTDRVYTDETLCTECVWVRGVRGGVREGESSWDGVSAYPDHVHAGSRVVVPSVDWLSLEHPIGGMARTVAVLPPPLAWEQGNLGK